MMEFSGKNSSENLYLLHAARLMTRLIRVWPAVDSSWKALLYNIWIVVQASLNTTHIVDKPWVRIIEFSVLKHQLY